MGNLIKWLLVSISALVGLLLIACILIVVAFDPNDYKPLVVEKVKEATGRDLIIEGDLSWQFWPPIGISIGKTQLNNTEAFGGTPMMKLGKAVVDVEILPLFKQQVRIDEITVDDFYLHLITKENGETNLDDLTAKQGAEDIPDTQPEPQPESEPQPVPRAQEREPAETVGFAFEDISFGKGISINNAVIINEDQKAGATKKVDLRRFYVGQFAFGNWFDLGLELALEIDNPQLLANLSWQSQLNLDKAMQSLKLREGVLSIVASGKALPKPVTLTLNTAADFDFASETASISPLNLSLDTLNINAPIQIKQLKSKPEVNIEVRLDTFNARSLLEDMGLALETANEAALRQVAMQTNLGFNAESSTLSVADLVVSLDDTKVTGNASVKTGEILVSRFGLNVDQLNLDDYLPPPKEGTEAPAPAEKAPPPDLSALKSMDVEGKVTVGSLTASKMQLQNISVDLLVRNGKLLIKPFTADMYQGKIRSEFTLDSNPQVPEFKVQQSITGLQVNPLLVAAVDKDILAGTTEFTASITGKSLDPVTIQETLNGQGRFTFRDGAVKGVNVAQMIRDAQAALSGEKADAVNEPKQTDFSEMGGTFTIVNGLVNNPDLNVLSPLLRIRGQGDIDLPAQQLNYQTKVSVVDTLKGQGGKAAADLKRLTIPLRIKGSFAEPDINLDFEGALKAKVEEKVQEEGKKLEEKAKEKISEKLTDFFKKREKKKDEAKQNDSKEQQ